ncbi:MAG: FmdB family zinc ribbon protein, partial [Mycobacterium sp.]
MPTYEYRCKSCGEHLEVVQAFTDDALTACPACGGQLRKVFGSIGIAFKGSGFYRNDSRAAAKAASSDSSGTDAKPAASGEGGSSESKPAPGSAESKP